MHRRIWNKLCLLLSGIGCMTSCTGAPDPYFFQMRGTTLAIPKAYVDAGSGIDVPRIQASLRAQAASPPGYRLDEFYMVLDEVDGSPWTKERESAPEKVGIPNYLRIWVTNPEVRPLGGLPEALISRQIVPDKRLQSRDEFGLKAYRDVAFKRQINYLAQLDDGGQAFISCGGFDLPNPLCRATTSWQTLLLEYEFRFAHLANWREIHGRISNLLMTFKNHKGSGNSK